MPEPWGNVDFSHTHSAGSIAEPNSEPKQRAASPFPPPRVTATTAGHAKRPLRPRIFTNINNVFQDFEQTHRGPPDAELERERVSTPAATAGPRRRDKGTNDLLRLAAGIHFIGMAEYPPPPPRYRSEYRKTKSGLLHPSLGWGQGSIYYN